MYLITFLLGVFTLIYIWLKWNYSYWKRCKVPGPKPKLFVGNIGSTLNMSCHFGLLATDWYNEYSNEPYVGYYKMLKPAILARDPLLIKDILTTNFNSFRNNDVCVSKRFDALTATNPFFSKDDVWREGRKAISPMLSQSKIKSVMPVMNEVGADLIKFIKSFPLNSNFDAKDVSIRFMTQNVVKSTFSIDPGCFDKEKESEFIKASQELFAPSFLTNLKFLAMPFLPNWTFEFIPIPIVPAKMDKWFRDLVRVNKASRSKECQSNDLFQSLLQIQEKHDFDETFLAGHAISLYLDGTETTATALSYALYELAQNPQCQRKLYKEIMNTIAKYNGNITLEGLQEMTYLDGVIFEATRIHPPALWIRKVCTQPYQLPKTTEQTKPISIDVGTTVAIPIQAIQMDPKNFPNPTEFQPERFTDGEHNRHKTTFLTFGEGPRVCLGMRFAMAQSKLALIHIVLNFIIKISADHKPIVINPQTIISYPTDGILIQFESR